MPILNYSVSVNTTAESVYAEPENEILCPYLHTLQTPAFDSLEIDKKNMQ